jgi:hypothetical protein
VFFLTKYKESPLRHKREWRYSSTILDLSTRWRQVVSFMHLPFYPWGKSPQYPLDRMLGGPKYQSGCRGEEKNLALAGNLTPAITVPAVNFQVSKITCEE